MPEASFEQSVKQVEIDYYKVKKQLQQLQRIRFSLTLLIPVIVLFYVVSFVNHLKANYTWMDFYPHIQEETHRITPMLSRSLNELLTAAAPTYVRLGQEKFEETLPGLQAAMIAQWEGLSDSMLRIADQRIKLAIQRVEEKQVDRLLSQFPELQTPEIRSQFKSQWHDAANSEIVELTQYFVDLYSNDLLALQSTVDSFRSKKYAGKSLDDMTTHFIHLWIMLLDQEVLNSERKGGDYGI